MTTATWYLDNVAVGTTERSPYARNLLMLCPECGATWARVEQPGSSWTCSHVRCRLHGLGSLAGADWTSKPFTYFNLPRTLLLRELELAISRPDAYNP